MPLSVYTKISENINLTGANFDEIFEMSIKSKIIQMRIAFENEPDLNKSNLEQDYDNPNYYIVKESPIDSLFAISAGILISIIKCFTYFSALKDN